MIMHIPIHTCTVHAPHVKGNISTNSYVANYVFNHYHTYIVALYIELATMEWNASMMQTQKIIQAYLCI